MPVGEVAFMFFSSILCCGTKNGVDPASNIFFRNQGTGEFPHTFDPLSRRKKQQWQNTGILVAGIRASQKAVLEGMNF